MSSFLHVQTYFNLQDLKTGEEINGELSKQVMTAAGPGPGEVAVRRWVFGRPTKPSVPFRALRKRTGQHKQ